MQESGGNASTDNSCNLSLDHSTQRQSQNVHCEKAETDETRKPQRTAEQLQNEPGPTTLPTQKCHHLVTCTNVSQDAGGQFTMETIGSEAVSKLEHHELLQRVGKEGVVVRFQAPYIVKVERLPFHLGIDLGPSQVLVKTYITAVSAGTEMLVYRGRMPPDISTDATLAGETGEQSSKPFAYPASFGYANVGNIVAHGSKTPRTTALGSFVFAFREHTSWYITDADDVQLIPRNVKPADAAFLPNVETALSLAMDAAPLPGEIVAVVGQGIVGLLLVAVLKTCYGKTKVLAIDSREDRLRTAKNCAGADRTVHAIPDDFHSRHVNLRDALALDEPGVDVAVDVSGHGSGLDIAIRATRDGGRVVIGSWFGANDVKLSCLGGRFHRSHISLVASQVSAIPAHLSARWDKRRRFLLAWDILSSLMPSTTFPVYTTNIHDASRVYSEIDRGMHTQVLFEYQ